MRKLLAILAVIALLAFGGVAVASDETSPEDDIDCVNSDFAQEHDWQLKEYCDRWRANLPDPGPPVDYTNFDFDEGFGDPFDNETDAGDVNDGGSGGSGGGGNGDDGGQEH